MSQFADRIRQLHAKTKSLAMLIDWQRTLLHDVLGGFDHIESRLSESELPTLRVVRRARKAAKVRPRRGR